MQRWQLIGRQQYANTSCPSRSTANQALFLQVYQHSVDRRMRYAKVSLHVGFSRRVADNFGVVVDERQVLTLFLCVKMRVLGDRHFRSNVIFLHGY